MRGRRLLAAAAAIPLVLSACTVDPANPLPDMKHQGNTPLGRLMKHVSPEWTSPIQPAGKTAATVDTLVAIDLRAEGRPEAVALDLKTGQELWRKPAGVGAPTESTRLDAVVAATPQGHHVTAFFAPGGPKDPVKVVLADPRTGDQREVEVPNATGLTRCRVVGGLCADQIGPRGERIPVRIDPVNGKAERLRLEQGPVDRVADLDGGVYIARRDNQTFVGRVGAEAWEKPTSAWFGTDIEFPKTLHWTRHDPAERTLSISVRLKRLTDADVRILVSEMRSVVVDTATGEMLWEATGTSLWCPGATGVSCRGELAYARRDRTRPFVPVGGTVTYAGLPLGSETRWTQKLKDVVTATGPENSPLRVPSDVWVFRQGDRVQLGDPTTGEFTTLDDSHWMACESRRTVAVGSTRVTATAYRPCTARIIADDPAQFSVAGVIATATTQPPGSVAEDVPGYYAVTMPDRVAVFR